MAQTSPPASHQPYVPALGFRWLTRFYDPVIRATLREDYFKSLLVEQAGLRPGYQCLDLGCGTGTLTLMLKQACPSARVVGLDGDPDTLAIAREKVAAAGLDVSFHEGMAYAPPFGPGSFDRIVSSLVFHHLTTEQKAVTLAATRDLLRPGGELHIADFGKPQNALMWLASLTIRALDGPGTTEVNMAGRLPEMIRDAGFANVVETRNEMTLFGTLALYRGQRPGG